MRILVFLFCLTFCSAAFADITVTMSSTEGQTTEYYSKGKMAVYYDNMLDSLVSVPDRVIYTVNHAEKYYTKMSFDEVRRSLKEADTMLENSGVSSYVRSRDEQMKNIDVKVIKSSSINIAGFPCQEYVIMIRGRKDFSKVCISKNLKDLIQKDFDLDRFKDVYSMENERYKVIAEVLSSSKDVLEKQGFLLYEYTQTDSFLSEDSLPDNLHGASPIKYECRVLSVSNNTISKDKFALPGDYREFSYSDMMDPGHKQE